MSGFCGWLETNPAAMDNRQIMERMTKPLTCFDNSPVQTIIKGDCALSIAAAPHLTHLYEADDLLITIYGDIKFKQTSVQSDTRQGNVAAVLADQWRQRGKAVFATLAGEFVCCVYERNTGKLYLAVDPMGTRTLYYQPIHNGILFATRADSLLAHPQAITDINPQAIFNYFYFHMIPAPDSIYQAQKKLLPGELLTFAHGQIQCERYTQTQFDETSKRSFSELKQEFLTVLKTSVCEAIQNKQVGTFLSGGTDSSTLAGILTEASGKPAKTY